MCGIAGIVDREGISDPTQLAEKLCTSLSHRGPDSSGHYYDPGGSALLAHTRLSIIDPTDNGRQPMTLDGRYYLIFNGEIYNHRELRHELEKDGAHFKTSSDTEVVLQLLIQRGKAALSLLQGMFALALWDTHNRTLLLARDPFGMKPLYLAEKNGRLSFASELRTLLQASFATPRFNHKGLRDYLLWGCSGRSSHLIEGVQQLPPGFSWEWKAGVIDRRFFGRIPIVFRENNATPEDFRAAWLDSVERHFVSDVPVGLFLSGGIDSSSVLAAAIQRGHKPSLTMTLDLGKEFGSEVEEAKRLASFFNTRHVAYHLTSPEILTLFHSHLDAQDRPSMDGFNIYCVSHAAKTLGLKVMLTGLGGDELLGGYPSFTRIPRMMSFLKVVPPVILRYSKLHHLAKYLGNTRWARLAEWADGPLSWNHSYKCYRGIFPNATISIFLKELGLEEKWEMEEDLPPSGPEWEDGRIQVARLEFLQYLQQQLLGDGDSCSMAHGVELRHPFLDEVLWRTGASLPALIRFDLKKGILKKCLPELPDEIFKRPKMGFSMPYNSWFKETLYEFETLVPPAFLRHAQTWYQKTALISLFSWLHKNRVSI